MNKRKTAVILVIIMILALGLSACSLFGGGDKAEGELPELKKRFYFTPGEPFVVNLKQEPVAEQTAADATTATTNTSKKAPPLAKVSVSLVTLEKDMTAVLEQNQPAIRNICIEIIRNMTEKEARADDAIEVLEAEMTKQLTEFLNMPEFHAVYISDFVIQ